LQLEKEEREIIYENLRCNTNLANKQILLNAHSHTIKKARFILCIQVMMVFEKENDKSFLYG
jgi:hypothetical protein